MNKGKIFLILMSSFFLNKSLAFSQNDNSIFYNNYLKANFFDKKFSEIKSYSFDGYKKSGLGRIEELDKIDSLKYYSQKPNFARSENYYPNKRNYCFNGDAIIKSTVYTDFKPEIIRNNADPVLTSKFINTFITGHNVLSKIFNDSFVIVSDSVMLNNKRCYKLTQKFNEEVGFEYFIEYKTLLLQQENQFKNGIMSNQYNYSDYRKVDGIYFPFLLSEKSFIGSRTLIFDTVILKLVLNPVLPKNFFDCQ